MRDNNTSIATSMTRPERKAEPPLIDPKMLELLVCPKSRKPLQFDAARQELVCEESELAYPVRDGVPILLISEARRLDD